MATIKILYTPISELQPYARNAKLHPKKQVQQIADSITEFGFINPVIIDQKRQVIAGHGRLEAAKLLKLEKVPTILADHLADEQVKAYRLADNQLTLNSGFDMDLLQVELSELASYDLAFDIEVTGFEMGEIDALLEEKAQESDPADAVPEVHAEAITQTGDVWQIGKHRLICGDSLQEETYKLLLGEKRAQMVFTDPPYNVPIHGNVCGNGEVKHREFAMASGEMSPQEFTQFLHDVFQQIVRHSQDGSLHFHCMDWRHISEIYKAGMSIYDELKNLCVWVKNNGGMGTLYRSQHELVFVFKYGNNVHINNVELGKHGRYRTNVWNYAGVNSFGEGQKDLALHPTVKPVAMVADAIMDCSKRGGIVLDTFAGSGTTLVAAQKTGRIGYGIEIDPIYCDVIVRRMQQLFELKAVHEASGKTFNEVEEVRHDG